MGWGGMCVGGGGWGGVRENRGSKRDSKMPGKVTDSDGVVKKKKEKKRKKKNKRDDQTAPTRSLEGG